MRAKYTHIISKIHKSDAYHPSKQEKEKQVIGLKVDIRELTPVISSPKGYLYGSAITQGKITRYFYAIKVKPIK